MFTTKNCSHKNSLILNKLLSSRFTSRFSSTLNLALSKDSNCINLNNPNYNYNQSNKLLLQSYYTTKNSQNVVNSNHSSLINRFKSNQLSNLKLDNRNNDNIPNDNDNDNDIDHDNDIVKDSHNNIKNHIEIENNPEIDNLDIEKNIENHIKDQINDQIQKSINPTNNIKKGPGRPKKNIENNSNISTTLTSNSSSTASTPDSSSSSPSSPSSSSSNDNNSNSSFDIYPQMLAVPIDGRPLLPGSYTTIIITDPKVIDAVQEIQQRKKPYITLFSFRKNSYDNNSSTFVNNNNTSQRMNNSLASNNNNIFNALANNLTNNSGNNNNNSNIDLSKDTINSSDEIYHIGTVAKITQIIYSNHSQCQLILYINARVRLNNLFPIKTLNQIELQKFDTLKLIENQVIKDLKKEGKSLKKLDQSSNIVDKSSIHLTGIEDHNNNFIDEKKKRILKKLDELEIENPSRFLSNYPVSLVSVSPLKDFEFNSNSPLIRAYINQIVKAIEEISIFSPNRHTNLFVNSSELRNEPGRFADTIGNLVSGDKTEIQDILETLDIYERLKKVLILLTYEITVANNELEINRKMRAIMESNFNKKPISMKRSSSNDPEVPADEKTNLIEKFRKRLEKLTVPEAVQKVIDEEQQKLKLTDSSSSEFGLIRNYLEWLTQIPWGVTTPDEFNIKSAITSLDKDHYGLKSVKDRILEFIAVGKLLGSVDGKIICLVGPPGVGKTSVGKSIAKALNRKFARFSVGGLYDVAEIKGHRRTYVGALPGKIVQSLKQTQSQNPLILIDEIDKLGYSNSHGDPSAALLEVLDPQQNNAFLDTYLDLPVDLSKILFVCTANTLSTIPPALLDRMEVIQLSGYIAEEKIQIAKDYLDPIAKKEAGLENANVKLTEDAIRTIVNHYCRENGVRNLKKQIEKIYRKSALNIVKEIEPEIEPETELVEETVEKSEVKAVDEEVNEGGIEKIDFDRETIENNKNEHNTETNSLKDKILGESSSLSFSGGDGTSAAYQAQSQDAVKIESSVKSENKANEKEETTSRLLVPDSVKVEINNDNLKDYVGPIKYLKDRIYDVTPPGVVMGLAWTEVTGCALYVESILELKLDKNSRPCLEKTGYLGDVMKESSQIAYSFSRMFLNSKFPENRFFERAAIHLHCPQGGISKDGPSAGITMVSSLLSLALNQSLAPTVAMTGEITLTGKVLPIGGLKEKVIAAKNSGAITIVFPKDNLGDWAEIPEIVRNGLEPCPVDWYSDVFDKIFPADTITSGNDVWKKEFELIDQEEKADKLSSINASASN
ncbi:ATP-dependent Lon protease PIM1 [Ascoidea rubescens DSM 1968]|uniref:Lon protease homolog n=1 Tax=Ascoidea rubescens DSM 1968 TaxID=1344418 RepID=A0A1D2VAT6_9ASCO|nr:ATP-dependent protease La [Ascoidea rubescens DSM 1968]ODV58710.1 ATP-dependent protease La [Ascoidea rubescens DSM 1968]